LLIQPVITLLVVGFLVQQPTDCSQQAGVGTAVANKPRQVLPVMLNDLAGRTTLILAGGQSIKI
jgi:hypothetical protein